MSGPYIQRLRGIRDEYEVARQSLAYVNQNWDGKSLFNSAFFQGIEEKTVNTAIQNIEVTYFVRLFAEFEGILKDHLQTNHPAVKVPAKPKVDDLIALAVKQKPLKVASELRKSELRKKVDDIRNYRNAIAHLSYGVVPIPFNDALSALNRFLAKLSDPL